MSVSIQTELEKIVAAKPLLTHPFYQAWSAGTLPKEKLATYAEEYGAFIRSLPQAWETLKDAETAQEEEEHAQLWADFAEALDTQVKQARLPETTKLVKQAKKLFSRPATAAGALFAFEVQQPETATSKLAGLRKHYALVPQAEVYFAKHTHNHHEAQKLMAIIKSLSKADQQMALKACKDMSELLWDVLTGIYAD